MAGIDYLQIVTLIRNLSINFKEFFRESFENFLENQNYVINEGVECVRKIEGRVAGNFSKFEFFKDVETS